MATELGQAYVQIIPSAKGISGKITSAIDPESKSAGKSAGNSIASGIKKAIAVAGIGLVLKKAVFEGAELEQSIGGIETLFKDSAGVMKKYADEAFKTVGVSANDYMKNVTSFSASLLQSMGGDTEAAAEIANMAMIDMGDNANKMGTDMMSIQNAYQGFAKQNYTMLDNLKLGYGGTKTEMERLLKDATKLSGVKYDISNLSDVYSAINVMQTELGIAGTTALEAEETITGSLNAMKASFTNLLGNLALGEDIKPSLEQLRETTLTFLNNLLPMVTNILTELPVILITLLKDAGPDIIVAGAQAISDLLQGLSQTLPDLIPVAIEAILLIVDTLLDNLPLIIDSGMALLLGLTLGIIEALPQLVDKIPMIIDSIIDTLLDNLPALIDGGFKLTVAVGAGLIKAIPTIVSKIPKIVSAILGAFGGLVGDFFDIGGNLVKGLWNGIRNVKYWLMDKIKGWVDSVIGGIKKFFGIKSPSKLMAKEVGKWLPEGLAVGIEGNVKPITDAMDDLGNTTISSFKPDLSMDANMTRKISTPTDKGLFDYAQLGLELKKALVGMQIVLDRKPMGEFVDARLIKAVV